VDHEWAAKQLSLFISKIDQLQELAGGDLIERIAAREVGGPSASTIAETLTDAAGLYT
jgi:hypothetical protein